MRVCNRKKTFSENLKIYRLHHFYGRQKLMNEWPLMVEDSLKWKNAPGLSFGETESGGPI